MYKFTIFTILLVGSLVYSSDEAGAMCYYNIDSNCAFKAVLKCPGVICHHDFGFVAKGKSRCTAGTGGMLGVGRFNNDEGNDFVWVLPGPPFESCMWPGVEDHGWVNLKVRNPDVNPEFSSDPFENKCGCGLIDAGCSTCVKGTTCTTDCGLFDGGCCSEDPNQCSSSQAKEAKNNNDYKCETFLSNGKQ